MMIYQLKSDVHKTRVLMDSKPGYKNRVKGVKSRINKTRQCSQEIDSVSKIFCLWFFLAVVFSVKTML